MRAADWHFPRNPSGRVSSVAWPQNAASNPEERRKQRKEREHHSRLPDMCGQRLLIMAAVGCAVSDSGGVNWSFILCLLLLAMFWLDFALAVTAAT
jgi:hypothetical protein